MVTALGNTRDPNRGAWCTPKWIADLVGPWRLDPFSNPRSHIDAERACMLERGDDGLGDGKTPGSHFVRAEEAVAIADETWRVWIQPDYQVVLRAFAHYRHTRWCALLRFDPSTEWFEEIYEASSLIAVPRGRRVNFEPPPGVRASSNAYPHALYYRNAEDATPSVLRACVAWRKKSR
jgi:hypothetical protein